MHCELAKCAFELLKYAVGELVSSGRHSESVSKAQSVSQAQGLRFANGL